MAALGMLLVLLSSSGVVMASYCYSAYTDFNTKSNRVIYKHEAFDCGSNSCCQGDSHDEFHCCDDGSWVAIVGILLGGLAGIGLIATIFVAACVYCTNASRRAKTPMDGRLIETPVVRRRLFRTRLTRPHITCINTYNIQPGHTVQPHRNQGFASDAFTA